MPETKALAERFVILLSHERSGSHYLADLIVSTGQVRSLDEVCNFNAVDPGKSEASFFRFRRAMQETDPDIILRPSPDSMGRLINAYLEHVAGLVDAKKRILLDIKYGHVHNFEIGWWPSERRPFLLSHLESLGIPIVHLHRRDSLASTISGHIADRLRLWHRKAGDTERSAEKMRLPPLKMAHEALQLEREKENFARWLAGAAYFDVEYEALAEDPAVRDGALLDLCEFLRLAPPKEFASKFIKVTPPLHEALENFEEIVKVVRLFGDGKLRV